MQLIKQWKIRKSIKKQKNINYNELLEFIYRCELEFNIPEDERIVFLKAKLHLNFNKINSLDQLLEQYFYYLHKKLNHYIDTFILDEDNLSKLQKKNKFTKHKKQECKKGNVLDHIYIDDFNNVRTRGNYLPGNQSDCLKLYISDDIMYDELSKIKYMLESNGLYPKKQLMYNIYLLQHSLDKAVTVSDIKTLNKNVNNLSPEIINYLHKIIKEINHQYDAFQER